MLIQLPHPRAESLSLAEFPARASGVPKAVFLIDPDGFRLAEQSATDNVYMATAVAFDEARARAQAHALKRALKAEGIPALSFAGDPATPDAVFPNNVFATAPGRIVRGAMRHPVRQAEGERHDLLAFFRDVLGYTLVDLAAEARQHGFVAELTGSLVIDRARGIGWCGLSERCDAVGAARMHAAFGLQATLVFPLRPGEYHTNVVLSALAGRGVAVCPDGYAGLGTQGDPLALMRRLYGTTRVIELDAAERAGFAGNCIALTPGTVWMSERAADSLRPASRASFAALGFAIRAVPLDEIEKAGGSLRCMIGEVY
jgi:hypothetical protein